MKVKTFLVDINDLLLLLGYTPASDELIGQATIHKALAEHDERMRNEARLEEAKWWNGLVHALVTWCGEADKRIYSRRKKLT